MPKSLLLRLAMAGALSGAASAPFAVPVIAQAQSLEPAAQQIETFDAALIRAMKEGKAGADAGARAKSLAPAVEATFDIPAMTGFAVGPAWASASAEDKAALTAAFRKFTIASYAKNFG